MMSMLYRAWLAVLFSALTLCAQANDFEPFAGPKPIAVLVQTDPAATVIGADTPRIAIYENGEVIYSRTDPKLGHTQYLHADLGFAGLAPLIDQIKTVVDLKGLKHSYALTDASGQSSAEFYLDVDNKEIVTSVYGLTSKSARGASIFPGPDSVPADLLKLYDLLREADFTDSDPWRPTYVEAMIWPYDDASGAPIAWPKDWPDLKSPRAMKRLHGWSIFIDGSDESDLADLLSTKKGKPAVEIDGQQWSVAYRPAFPSDPIWRKAFSRIDQD